MPLVISVRPQLLVRLALAFAILMFGLSAQAQNGHTFAARTGAGPTAGPADNRALELSAHDKAGNPVLDLKPSEVQIVEGGKQVPLNSLRLVTEPRVPPVVTLVFDEVVPGVAKTDHDLAEELLTAASGHGLLFMVLRVEGRLHLVQTPTDDVDAVRKAVAATTIQDRSEAIKVTEAAERQMEEDAKNATGSRQIMAKILKAMLLDSQHTVQTDGRTLPPLAALLAASRGQQVLPGRKFIVFFSQGLQYPKNSPETLRDITQAANRAHVSIYAVDSEIGDSDAASGMLAASAMGTEGAMGNMTTGLTDAAGTATVGAEFAGRMIAGEGGSIPHSLLEICLITGGGHVYALAGDSRTRARGIAADLTSYYLASWASPGSDAGRGRGVRVQSLRKGVVIESRFPARVGDELKASGAEARLIEALAAPQLAADLPLNAAVLRFGNTPDNDVNSVVVQVPFDRLPTAPDAAGGPPGTVSVLAQLKDKSGAVVRRFSADIPRQSPIANGQPAAREMVGFRRQFSAPPGEYVLESAAMDGSGGKIGAARTSVVIPPAATGLTLGDVVLVGSIDPAASEGLDPLRCKDGTVVPNLSGHVVKAATPKLSMFFSLHTDPSSTEVPSLSAEISRDGVEIGSVPLKLNADLKGKTTPYIFTLGTASLHPGQYRTAVILSQGGQKVSQSVSFALE